MIFFLLLSNPLPFVLFVAFSEIQVCDIFFALFYFVVYRFLSEKAVTRFLSKTGEWQANCVSEPQGIYSQPLYNRAVRAYSFCAVFLFRFINRNGNKRVQKEQFSSERNNFQGNKMAHSLISLFLFQFINRNGNKRVQKEQFSSERNNFQGNQMAHSLISNRKGKKCEKIIRERSSKNMGGYFDKLLVFADRVIFFVLSRQSYLSSWIPSGNGELLLFWKASFSKGKWWERCGTLEEEEELDVLSVAAVVLRWKRAPKRLFSDLSRRQGNKRKRRCSCVKKKKGKKKSSQPTCL